jgi:hypothetical protein
MASLYTLSLFLHSWNRWLIIIAGIIVIVTAIKALMKNSDYSPFQRKWLMIYMSSLHLQLLVGILLYFVLSPVTAQALNNFGAAMKDPVLRFWAIEHSFTNFVAIVLAQTGSILVKRRVDAAGKNRHALLWTSISFFLIISMIPMGMMGVERPWFRF